MDMIELPKGVIAVADGAPEEEWLEGREAGPTASRIWAIARGSRKRWRSILDEMLNGSTFRGNAFTERGHEAEAEILAEILKLEHVETAALSSALIANVDELRHLATPDGFGRGSFGPFGLELKWHDAKWIADRDARIPADHLAQCDFGMHVTGLDLWLYAYAIEGVPGIFHQWITRDQDRIGFLVRQADDFIAWRAAGAPEIDDLPDYVDEDLATYAEGMRLETIGKKMKEGARPGIESWARGHAAAGDPLRKSGSRAGVFYEPKPDTTELDEEAWQAAEPETHAEWRETVARADAQRAAAAKLYTKPKPVAATFRVTPNGVAA